MRAAFAAPYRTKEVRRLQPAVWLDSACVLLDVLVDEFVILHAVVAESPDVETLVARATNAASKALLRKVLRRPNTHG